MSDKKMTIVDYVDVTGRVTKLVAYGHHDLDEFEKNCFDRFRAVLRKKFCGYHRLETITSQDGKKHKSMVQCASGSRGSKITIGIV